MKRLLLGLLLGLSGGVMFGGAVQSAASGLLSEWATPVAACRQAPGYVGMSSDLKQIMVCTSDGVMHTLVAR